MRNRRILYNKWTKFFLIAYLSLFLIGCSTIDKFINIVSGNVEKPKWNYEFSAPLVEMNLDPEKVFNNLFDINKYLKDVSIDASFDKVDYSNYAELKDLGMNLGDYFFKYETPFSIPNGIFESDIALEIVDTLASQTNEFEYNLDLFPIIPFNENDLFIKPNIGNYRWPIEENSMGFNINKLGADFISDPAINKELFQSISITVPEYFNFNENVDIPLNQFDLDIDGDNISDINLKGVNLGSDARITIYISLIDNMNVDRSAYLYSEDINFEYIKVEGNKYLFEYKGKDSYGDLIFESTNFQNSTFNFGGDENKDYTMINFEGLKFSILGGFDKTIRYGPTVNKIYLSFKGKVNFGSEYSLICDINPMTFNLGYQDMDLSGLVDFIDTDYTGVNDYVKAIFAIASSISLANASLILDLTNDLPLSIDLSKMFDDALLTTYDIKLNSSPVDTGVTPANGGFISYFDLNNDNIYDKYSTLNIQDYQNIVVSAGDGLNSGFKKIVITNKNSNISEFFEQLDNLQTNLKRPSKVCLINTIGIAGQTDAQVKIQQFSLDEPIKLNGVIYIPVSLKILKEKTDLGIQNIMNDFRIPISGSFLSNIPINELEELSISITGINNLPIGVDVSFDLVTSDDSKRIPLIENGFIGINPVINGSVYVNSNGLVNIDIEANKNFKYIDATGDERYYDGNILDFFKEFAYNEQSAMKMNIGLSIVPTKDENGEVVPVSFTLNDSFQIKASAKGKFIIDMNEIIK